MRLCRERLARIQHILNKNAGVVTVRDFARSFSVWEWELEQAAALGWIQIETRKPNTGRPSRIVKIVSKPDTAKLPPFRWQIEKPIRIRHWSFAFHSVYSAIKGGSSFLWRIQPSMSRLLRHPDVRAARAWFFSKISQEIPREEPMPDTARAIWQRLRELGSWRVRA